MVKKYLLTVTVLLTILLFTSTVTSLRLSSSEKIIERLQENSVFRIVSERISQITYDNNFPSHDDIELNGLKEDGLLPKIWNMIGEKTPDDGNLEVTDLNIMENTSVIDINGEVDKDLNDKAIIDEFGEMLTINEIVVDKDGEVGRTIERVIEIITEHNEIIGTMLEMVVEHTYAPGTAKSNGIAENIVDTVVIEGESNGICRENKVDVIVLTANDQ